MMQAGVSSIPGDGSGRVFPPIISGCFRLPFVRSIVLLSEDFRAVSGPFPWACVHDIG